MRVLGIDPGMARMGYGILEGDQGKLQVLDVGVLSTEAGKPPARRLAFLYQGLSEIIQRHQPSEVAVETFVGRNLRSALAVGQARGVALLAAAHGGLPVFEYTPMQVKQVVVGYGRGDKQQVQEMLKLQLGLTYLPQPDDAADALAVAFCHIHMAHISQVLGQAH
ncbi:MAG: crossover junction endodeoxyribonuclease RuvC [Chloroflexota bacterium]|nr:crossover junction endodeoxyribonuclease RuvC [Chloroflexota bacterium]